MRNNWPLSESWSRQWNNSTRHLLLHSPTDTPIDRNYKIFPEKIDFCWYSIAFFQFQTLSRTVKDWCCRETCRFPLVWGYHSAETLELLQFEPSLSCHQSQCCQYHPQQPGESWQLVRLLFHTGGHMISMMLVAFSPRLMIAGTSQLYLYSSLLYIVIILHYFCHNLS